MKIILVRHGETEANRRRCFAESNDIPLTDTGRLQAQQIALRLARDFRPSALLSSPYARARETSEIISSALGLTAEVIDGIHERDFGSLKGLPYERLGNPGRLWKPEGGESLEDVRLRVVPVLDDLRARYQGQEVVVVCHGAVIRSICSHITGDWDETHVVDNCGIAVIEFGVEVQLVIM
jgi:broad specificity phosphatase PhoE